jgi:hypothetical protein
MYLNKSKKSKQIHKKQNINHNQEISKNQKYFPMIKRKTMI